MFTFLESKRSLSAVHLNIFISITFLDVTRSYDQTSHTPRDTPRYETEPCSICFRLPDEKCFLVERNECCYLDKDKYIYLIRTCYRCQSQILSYPVDTFPTLFTDLRLEIAR